MEFKIRVRNPFKPAPVVIRPAPIIVTVPAVTVPAPVVARDPNAEVKALLDAKQQQRAQVAMHLAKLDAEIAGLKAALGQ